MIVPAGTAWLPVANLLAVGCADHKIEVDHSPRRAVL